MLRMLRRLPQAPGVTEVKVVGDSVLFLKFTDGEWGFADLRHLLEGAPGIYAELADPDYFGLAHVDPEARTVVWPNGADIAPETLRQLARHLPPEGMLVGDIRAGDQPEGAVGSRTIRVVTVRDGEHSHDICLTGSFGELFDKPAEPHHSSPLEVALEAAKAATARLTGTDHEHTAGRRQP